MRKRRAGVRREALSCSGTSLPKVPRRRAKWRATRSTKCVGPCIFVRIDEEDTEHSVVNQSSSSSPPTSRSRFAAPEGVPQQVEMPFAVVNGEPVTELPKDLYIPPQALEVFLEAFEGPLDLLLYLIRRQNLDILDIPLAEITRQYMTYIEVMQDLQLELAGEYMVMAATLAGDQVAHAAAAAEARHRR